MGYLGFRMTQLSNSIWPRVVIVEGIMGSGVDDVLRIAID
jgi:hypothetical protein